MQNNPPLSSALEHRAHAPPKRQAAFLAPLAHDSAQLTGRNNSAWLVLKTRLPSS